jgi:transposase
MMKVFPTPSCVRSISFEDFRKKAEPLMRRTPYKYSILKDYYSLAGESVGIPVRRDSYEVEMFRYSLEEHDRLSAKLETLTLEIENLLGQNPDYIRLKSIPGIGPLIALTVLAEGGDLRRFGHERQFLKYCGLNLSTKQSGISRGNSKLSKRGNPRLRSAFWQAAKAAMHTKNENSIKDKFKRYVQSDPENADLKRKARTATAAKIARIAYGLIKKGEVYRSNLEKLIQIEEPVGLEVEAVTS